MKNTVTVFSPASISNIGPGFDVLGFAIDEMGDKITLSRRADSAYKIESSVVDLPVDPASNVATVALKSFCDHIGYQGGFDIHIEKNFKPSSGLGSSAASAAGAVFAANSLLESGFSKSELVPFALDGEQAASQHRHADNVAPCMLGGLVGVKSCDPFEAFSVNYPSDLKVLVVFPDVPIKTAEARKLLPNEIDLKTGIEQWANMGGLITGLMSSDYELIKSSLNDFVAEPARKGLIPLYDQVKALALENGAMGYNISGSGPAMFGLFRSKTSLSELRVKIQRIYESSGIAIKFHESGINDKGVQVIS